MIDELGFGDFQFRLPNGKMINKAKNIKELVTRMKKINTDSIKFVFAFISLGV